MLHSAIRLAQEIYTLWFQFYGAVFASKGHSFKNIFVKPQIVIKIYVTKSFCVFFEWPFYTGFTVHV